MSLGISNALKAIADLQAIAVDGVKLVKAFGRGAMGLGAVLAAVFELAAAVKDLVADAPAALPELKDLDTAEAGQAGAAAYDCVKAVIAALAA